MDAADVRPGFVHEYPWQQTWLTCPTPGRPNTILMFVIFEQIKAQYQKI